MNTIKLLAQGAVWVLALLLLTSCSEYRGQYGSRTYVKDSRSIPPLVIPAGIHSPVEKQYYAVKQTPSVHRPPAHLYPPDPNFLRLKRQSELKNKG